MNACMHAYIQTYIHIYKHSMHAYKHSMHTYIPTYIQYKHTYIHTNIHSMQTYIHTMRTYIHTMQTRRNHSEILSVKLCFEETFTVPLPSLLIKTRNCQKDYQKKSHGVKSNWFWSTATIQRYHSSKSMKLKVFSELYLRKYNSP